MNLQREKNGVEYVLFICMPGLLNVEEQAYFVLTSFSFFFLINS
jgi:hypothetical protein